MNDVATHKDQMKPYLRDLMKLNTRSKKYVEVKMFKVRTNSSKLYSVFHQFWQAKFAHSGSFLSLSQFLILQQLPQEMKFASKVEKTDLETNISIPKI